MSNRSTVYVVDDDAAVRESLALLLKTAGYAPTCLDRAESFLELETIDESGCAVIDLRLPGMSGLADIADKMEELEDISVCRLEAKDIVRHPLVATMLTVL